MLGFESSVVLYGTQTYQGIDYCSDEFESSVVLYGTQTRHGVVVVLEKFESSAICCKNGISMGK